MIQRRLILLLLLAAAAAGVLPVGSADAAGPTISSTSGPLQHGGALVLIGSGFSSHPDFHTHTDKLVQVFDDFNDGTLNPGPYGTWYIFNEAQQPAVFDTSGPRTPVAGDGHYRRRNTGLGFLGKTAGNHQEYWFESYVRLNSFDICTEPSGTHQFKVVRLSSTNTNVNVYPAIGCSDGWNHAAEFLQPEVLRWMSQVDAIPNQPSGWNHLAVYYKKSSAPNVNDGKAQIFWNRRLVWDWASHYADPRNDPDNVITGDFDSDGADLAGDWAVGNYFSSASASTSVDFDDVFLNHTQARVLLCNANTFTTATLCETQPPASWTDARIEVKTNLGALPRNGTLYAYVVDRNGAVSPAFPVSYSVPTTATTTTTTVPGTCTPGSDQAALYEHPNYQGACVVKGVGTYRDFAEFAPVPDNAASSVRVGANVQINPCQGEALTGYCQTFRTDVADLTGSGLGNDTAGSVQVQARTPGCYPNADQVALYEHANYQGACVIKGVGTYNDGPSLTPLADNTASSVRAGANVSGRLCQGTGLGGDCQTFITDVPDLSASSISHETVSSLQVALR